MAGHLAHDEERGVAEVHHLARLDGQCGRLLRGDRGHELGHALGDGDAVLVELVLPQEAIHQAPAQFLLGRESAGAAAFMGEDAQEPVA